MAHVVVKILQIIFTPVAAILGPSGFPGLHPGIKAIESIREFFALVFVDEQRRIRPSLRDLADFVPVSAGILGKNENYGLAVVAQIGLP